MTISELLATVRRVEVRTNRLVNDTMVGAYLSRFKGRGMDFEELREYMPGDDIRDIDWNVTNRMGRPFVKRYREERELTMVLAVDVSASSAFGSLRRTKREFAAEIAATLAAAAARTSDKVALLLFTDRVELFVPPRKGRRHLLRLIRELVSFEPKQRGTDIPAALTFLNHVLRRRAIVFLLTDFLHSNATSNQSNLGLRWQAQRDTALASGNKNPIDAKAPSPLRSAGAVQNVAGSRDVIAELGLTNASHDLVCLHLHDPRESELPDAGIVTVEDAETGEVLELDSGRRTVREKFARLNAERLAALDLAFNRAGVDTLRFNTAEPFAATLQRFFETRRGRRRG
jgi:uncharacterized protein (DUF58 family)